MFIMSIRSSQLLSKTNKSISYFKLGAVHKGRPQSEGLSSADKEGVLQMRTSALFGVKKLRILQNLWYVDTDKRGVEPVRTFCGQ